MNRDKIKKFLADPTVKKSLKDGDVEKVAMMASSLGNLSRDADLRELATKLTRRTSQEG